MKFSIHRKFYGGDANKVDKKNLFLHFVFLYPLPIF